jgi:hypothetical protein
LRIPVKQQAEPGLIHPWFLDKNKQNILDFWAKILKIALTSSLNYLTLPMKFKQWNKNVEKRFVRKIKSVGRYKKYQTCYLKRSKAGREIMAGSKTWRKISKFC